MTWTDARIEQLKSLRAGGMSFGLIAAELGGVSRNAVIGKALRLGLLGHGESRTTTTKARGGKRQYTRRNAIKIVPDVGTQLTELPVEIVSNPVNLFDLRAHHCRWPVSGEGIATMFCGGSKFGQHSYCAGHCRMAYARFVPDQRAA